MTDRDDDLGAELRQETIRLAEGVVALRQRIVELERLLVFANDERTLAYGQYDRALAAARDLRAALKPLAEQDCESWGCDLILSHRCAPAIAVSVLARTAWLDAPEERRSSETLASLEMAQVAHRASLLSAGSPECAVPGNMGVYDL